MRGRKAPAYRKRWGERYGFYRHPLKPGGIMLHSVSVGETLAAIPLVRARVIVILIYDYRNNHDTNRFGARTNRLSGRMFSTFICRMTCPMHLIVS